MATVNPPLATLALDAIEPTVTSTYQALPVDVAGLTIGLLEPKITQHVRDTPVELAVSVPACIKAKAPTALPAVNPAYRFESDREAALVQDVLDLMHDEKDNETAIARVKRWIRFVLQDLSGRPPRWPVLDHVVSFTLQAGQDVVDLQGDLDFVVSVFHKRRLNNKALSDIVSARQSAQFNAASEITHYAIEGDKRLHLWPAPSETMTCALLYSRPMDLRILPERFDLAVFDGVIGLFGQHFDRDALTQSPARFEKRYLAAIPRLRSGHRDATLQAWDDRLPSGTSTALASSSLNTANRVIVPASTSNEAIKLVALPDYPDAYPSTECS